MTLLRLRPFHGLACALALMTLGGCAGDSGIGVNTPPQAQAVASVLENWDTIRAHAKISRNATFQRTAQEVSGNVLRAAGENPLEWEVMVFEGEDINTFVLPSKKIGVYEGMFQMADTPDELAAAISHEIGHLEMRRTATYAEALPYSPTQERHADDIGLSYMAKAGYDPGASAALWRQMGERGEPQPEFLATHPNPGRRMAAFKPRAGQLKITP